MRRNYTVVDLLRFHRLAKEHPELKPMTLLSLYDETYPELSAEQKMENLKNFFRTPAERRERRAKK